MNRSIRSYDDDRQETTDQPGPDPLVADAIQALDEEMGTEAIVADGGDRPVNCECDTFHDIELPCFACHRAGFETVNDGSDDENVATDGGDTPPEFWSDDHYDDNFGPGPVNGR